MDIKHGLRVAAKIDFREEPEVWVAALLHDSIEDGDVSATELLNSYLPYHEVIEVIQILTRSKDENYRDYIERLAFDDTARRIKIADLKANLDRMDKEHESLKPRYVWALEYLRNYTK